MTRMTGPDCVVMCNLINTYIHTYRHTDIPVHTYRHTDIQTYRHTDIQTYRHTDIPVHTYRHTDKQTGRERGRGRGRGWGPEGEHRMGTGTGTGTRVRTVAEMGTETTITGTRIGLGRAEGRRKSARNRKIAEDAARETGETWIESEKNVEKKGLVQ